MSHAPYIMPDGRPLGQFLYETQEENLKGKKRGQGSKRERRASKSDSRANWQQSNVPSSMGEEDTSHKLGRDRRRRYLNERILRDMAGALTAADMEALFKPVPFGRTNHESPLSQVTAPEGLPVWDVFRNIDEEKQNNTLQKWETAARSQKRGRQGEEEDEFSALSALKCWASVPKKAREAMKRCAPEVVETLELPILELLDKAEGAEESATLELELEDAYQRLMAHGIAIYHKLKSSTNAQGNTLLHLDSSHKPSPKSSKGFQITCSDICFAISQDSPGGLTAEILYKYWKRLHYGTDAESEASYVMV